jgi:UDP-hydrolysing UDP-N-acetyl-D-glucosamine 2-epimerase
MIYSMIKKICVVVASRANYARVKYLMKSIDEDKKLQLQLIVGASALIDRFGKAIDVIKNDGFEPLRTIDYLIEGETLITQAKSTGLGIIELSTAFASLKPDAVVTVADRFETMSTAIASSYLNIPLIHLQGGEVSGNIDDRVRHAITKLADYHFPATEISRDRVINMNEDPTRVFNFGCPSMDILKNIELSLSNNEMNEYGGIGYPINWEQPYILMMQHPVTTSYGNGFKEVISTLNAIREINDIQKVVLWPNSDAGSDDVSKGIRVFREKLEKEEKFHFYRNFTPEHYAKVLNNALCLVGNSSSFIREGSFLGKPAVIVGDRQNLRECGCNVLNVGYDSRSIQNAIEKQINIASFDKEFIFGNGNAGKLIASKISELDLSIK